MIIEKWPANDRYEMFDFRFNTLWFRNPGFLRRLDLEKMRRLMSLAP